jgi:hypothetical protein
MNLIFNSRLIIIFCLFFGCSSFSYQSPVDYEKIADAITANTAKKLEEQKKLYLIGTGGGMMHDIQAMHMSFQFFHEVDLQEGRELIVYAVREYLSDINNNEEVRPYLHNYPFTAKNVEIMIFVYGPDRRELPPEKIGCITSIDGILEYYTRADDDHPICEETYEEALGKIT